MYTYASSDRGVSWLSLLLEAQEFSRLFLECHVKYITLHHQNIFSSTQNKIGMDKNACTNILCKSLEFVYPATVKVEEYMSRCLGKLSGILSQKEHNFARKPSTNTNCERGCKELAVLVICLPLPPINSHFVLESTRIALF